MDDRLPPLTALRAFEAAARHLNFSRAADELHVTHGAISHQMKALEAHLGVALFRRQGRAMQLTEAGERLQAHVGAALQQLRRGVAELRAAAQGETLTVTTTPSFATRWLLPRLGDFQAGHPEIDIHLRATPSLADFARDGIDLGIRYGAGSWSGLDSVKLLDEEIFPVCSPTFRGGRLPTRIAELRELPLLRDARQPWREWFLSVGLDWAEPARGAIYDDPGLLLEAAIGGSGIALARSTLAKPELAAGRLVRLFDDRARPGAAYYLVHAPGAQRVPKIATFRDWLIGQAAGA